MYNTGNPVPSAALEDMADNAQTFDALVTKTDGTTTDRNGITRRVFQQILMDMGFQPLSGSFQTGATITARNQTLYDEVSHVFYAWGGVIPDGGYVVPAGSTPSTAGGVGAGAWSDKTDLMLRSELSSDVGAALVGFKLPSGVSRTLSAKAADLPTASDYLLASETDLKLAIDRAKADGVTGFLVTKRPSAYTLSSMVELPDDFEIIGIGRPSVVCANVENIIRLNSRTRVSGLRFSGLSPAVLTPQNGAKDVMIDHNFFSGQNQLVLLLACSNIDIISNVFEGTGYGIIQQEGYASDNVRIIGNTARDMMGDFVEANCAYVNSKNWLIANNIYEGARDWQTIATERRFVGITQVEDVVITNNFISRTAGDSAVHLEDLLGRSTVSQNTFVDCFAGQGAVYNLNSSKDMTVNRNLFVLTDDYSGENKCAIRTDSGFYTHKCSIKGNWFVDATTAGKVLKPAFLSQGGEFDFDDNWCVNTYDVASFNTVTKARFMRNRALGQLQRGIWADTGVTGGASSGVVYEGNHIPSLVEPAYAILATTNTNGTNGPKRHVARNNDVGGDIRLQNLSGAVGQTSENVAFGNRVTGTIVVSDRLTADAYGNYTLTSV